MRGDPQCCNHSDDSAKGEQVENDKAKSRTHFCWISQGVLNEAPDIDPHWSPDQNQCRPVDDNFPSKLSQHNTRNIKEESQHLLGAKDRHQQSVEHPNVAI